MAGQQLLLLIGCQRCGHNPCSCQHALDAGARLVNSVLADVRHLQQIKYTTDVRRMMQVMLACQQEDGGHSKQVWQNMQWSRSHRYAAGRAVLLLLLLLLSSSRL